MFQMLFQKMYKTSEITYHSRQLDITHLKFEFDQQFGVDEPHDVYRFMMYLFHLVTLETVDKFKLQEKLEDVP